MDQIILCFLTNVIIDNATFMQRIKKTFGQRAIHFEILGSQSNENYDLSKAKLSRDTTRLTGLAKLIETIVKVEVHRVS